MVTRADLDIQLADRGSLPFFRRPLDIFRERRAVGAQNAPGSGE
jgi:hypothetical protein